MTWKTLSKIEMRNRENDTETFSIQYDGNFYRIQNEFGNISFEFDVSSGYTFAEELNGIITSDIESEINTFLTDQNIQNDNDNYSDNDCCSDVDNARQMSLFNQKNIKYKNIKMPKGLNVTINSDGISSKKNG